MGVQLKTATLVVMPETETPVEGYFVSTTASQIRQIDRVIG